MSLSGFEPTSVELHQTGTFRLLYRLCYRAVEKNKVTHLLDILSILVLADDLDLAAVVLVDVIDVDSEDVLVRLLSDLEVLVVHDLNVVQVPAADRLGYVQPYINTCFRIFL